MPALRAFAAGDALTLAAQPPVGALLAVLGVARDALDFDALALDALFVDDPSRTPRLPPADRVVCWFGSRDAGFVRRLRARVPGAIVAPSTGVAPVWRYLLDSVAAPPGPWCAPIPVPPDGRRAAAAWLHAAGWDGTAPLVIAHVGASGAAKRWAPAAFAAVLNESARDVVIALHAGPLDEEAVAAVTGRLQRPVLTLRHARLPDVAAALAHAAAFVGNDSGISQLAAAVGVSSVIVRAERNAAWVPWSASAMSLPVPLEAARAEDVARVREALAKALAHHRAA